MISEITQIAQGVGGLATAASLIWGILTYNKTRETNELFSARRALIATSKNISEIDNLLSESHFSGLGDEIAKEMVSMKSNNEPVLEFCHFISSDDGHDFVARAIHLGRLNCQITEKYSARISELNSLSTDLSQRLPIIAYAINKFSFYIRRTTSLASSPKVFDMVLGRPDAMKRLLLPNIDEQTTTEQLRVEIGLLASACPSTVLKLPIGQRLFDESEKVIKIIVEAVRSLTDHELRKHSKFELVLEKKLRDINLEHSADDALEALKMVKGIFTESQWDSMVTAKANMVMLVQQQMGEQGAQADA